MIIKNNRIEIEPIKNPKKITATKLSQILGIGNSGMYTTPFQVWCDICRVYTKPFEENKYTNAGKHIEPKQLKYIKEKYDLKNLVTPEDRYGPQLQYIWDFFPEQKVFGGKWDSLTIDLNTGETRRVIECKTAQLKKKKDWIDGVPSDYKVQASLYAYLLGVDGITFVTSFLTPEDYDHPQDYVCTDENTQITQVFRSKDCPYFEEMEIKNALIWWNKHVLTGISPKYNEYIPEDMEIINYLRGEQKVVQEKLL